MKAQSSRSCHVDSVTQNGITSTDMNLKASNDVSLQDSFSQKSQETENDNIPEEVSVIRDFVWGRRLDVLFGCFLFYVRYFHFTTWGIFYYFIINIIICFYLIISWIYWLDDNRILQLNSPSSPSPFSLNILLSKENLSELQPCLGNWYLVPRNGGNNVFVSVLFWKFSGWACPQTR